VANIGYDMTKKKLAMANISPGIFCICAGNLPGRHSCRHLNMNIGRHGQSSIRPKEEKSLHQQIGLVFKG